MKTNKNLSVSFKITSSILVTFAAIFCVISVLIYSSVHGLLMKEVESRLSDTYGQISLDDLNGYDNIKAAIDDLGQKLEMTAFSPRGEVIYSNHARRATGLSSAEGFSEIRIDGGGEGEGEQADHYLIYRSPVLSVTPSLIIQISKDLEDEDRFFRILLEGLIIANLLGVGLAAFIGYGIGRRILHPVDMVTGKARAISAEDLTQRIPPSGTNDEISRLIDAFNGMLDRLEGSFEKQQRFVADASHELRTPVSVIQGYADMLQRWAKESPELLEESLDAIKTETRGMKSLIDRLLILARSDTKGLSLQLCETDLSSMIREMAGQYPGGETSRIGAEMPEQLIVLCDGDLIKQLLRILIDNAIKYSPRESPIEITARKDSLNGTCSVSVRDHGLGIEEDHLPRLFDRFYRVDDARGREEGGAGIGLSLAKEICHAHGGSIFVTSTAGEGSVFTFNLPLNIN
ncbi:MAG: HAMP domain-containing protein [Spirochaetales bacterium]|nr:HAMP domain-containing protein [Spirochaetales bacterium]